MYLHPAICIQIVFLVPHTLVIVLFSKGTSVIVPNSPTKHRTSSNEPFEIAPEPPRLSIMKYAKVQCTPYVTDPLTVD